MTRDPGVADRFLDTNIFLRHVLADHTEHSPAATALLDRIATGAERAWSTALAFAECVWVLSGANYRYSREEIHSALAPLCGLANLDLDARPEIIEALQRYAATSISFADCFHAALVGRRRPAELYSFDHDFDRITGVRRIEPPSPAL